MMTNDMPPGWTETTLGEIIELRYGKSLPAKNRDAEGDIAVYGSSGVVGRHSVSLVGGPCIVVGRKGNVGSVFLSKSDCWPIDTTYFVSSQQDIDVEFLYRLLDFLRLGKLDKSTAIPGLSRDDVYKLMVGLPPLSEQRRIVEKIETLFAELDKGEESLRQVQTLLARYRQSVLKAAVTGQLTADWRAKNAHRLEHGRDLLARILKARRESWEGRGKYKEPVEPDTSSLPELPEGWVWATVEQVVSVFRNGLSKKPISEPNEFPILRISATRSMSVSVDDVRYYPVTDPESVAPYWVEKGDLLFTRYNGSAHLVGVCGQMRSDQPVLHPDKLIKARAVGVDGLSVDFLEIAWNAGETRRHILSRIKTTSGQQGIAGADIKAAPFPLPPEAEQRAIVGRVQKAFERLEALWEFSAKELARSTALRQSILKDAFSGKLVPQDPNDEPAAELLARIKAARAGKSKQSRRSEVPA